MDSVSTVFVDRDGVLNRKARTRYVLSVGEMVLLPGAARAVALLSESGKRVFVVTNQRAVARGLLTCAELDRIHDKLRDQLRSSGGVLDGVYVCTHEIGTCTCRKPLPGLLLLASREHPEVDFARSAFVGDSADDVRAGSAVGCRTVLVGRGHRRATELASLQALDCPPTATALSLLDAAQRYILKW